MLNRLKKISVNDTFHSKKCIFNQQLRRASVINQKQTSMKKVFTHLLTAVKSVGFPPRLGGMCLVPIYKYSGSPHEQPVLAGAVKVQGSLRLWAGVLVKSTSLVVADADGASFRILQ